MKRYLFLLLTLLLTLLLACEAPPPKDLPTVTSGTIERIPLFPSIHISPRNIDIWLPEGYDKKQQYAVLYMHDGQMLYDAATTWNKQEWGVDEVMGKLIGEGIVEPCIVVGVWNGGSSRHSDYFPQKPFESLPVAFRDSLVDQVKRNAETALFSTTVQSDAYLRFLVQELKPYVDSHYSTLTDRAHTFVAGSSMGGLISMYALCEYPAVFGGAACLSTHWVGTFETENNPIPAAFIGYMKDHLPDPATHRLYFDYGTETLDALYEPFQLQVDSVMQEAGYSEENWQTLKFEGHDHSEKAWNKRLAIPLRFLLGE